MSQLLETIKIFNRAFQNIEFHNARFNASRQDLFGIDKPVLLENEISIPSTLTNDIYKCRITYSLQIEKVEFEKYTPRMIQSLKVVENNHINYAYKYADRSGLNELFDKRGECDDILIIKNGLVTDTSYSNIVFWDGKNWLTPSKPLLAGTARARLLKSNKIVEAEISKKDLKKFEKARIINAMNDLEESDDILIDKIFF